MMMKKVTALVIFAVMTAVLGFGQTSADEWFNKAGAYFESGDYANAVTAYSEAIKRGSSDLNAYLFRSFAYYQTKNYDAAIADCNTVIKSTPNFPDVYVVRGDAYGAKGLYHKAVADYRTGFEKGYDPSGFVVDKSSKADMWFCGAMYMEIAVNRFLGNSAVLTKYENRLKTVCDKSNITRAEVETFYRQNIGALVAAAVDAEFGKIKFLVKTDADSANAILVYKANQYILTCDGYWGNPKKGEIKQFSASSVDALLAIIRSSRDFEVPRSVDTIRENALLMPSISQIRGSKVSSSILFTEIMTGFYTARTPEEQNRYYKALLGFAARLHSMILTGEGNSAEPITRSWVAVLSAINPELARKSVQDSHNISISNLADLNNEVDRVERMIPR
jgi:hypothetical protein